MFVVGAKDRSMLVVNMGSLLGVMGRAGGAQAVAPAREAGVTLPR